MFSSLHGWCMHGRNASRLTTVARGKPFHTVSRKASLVFLDSSSLPLPKGSIPFPQPMAIQPLPSRRSPVPVPSVSSGPPACAFRTYKPLTFSLSHLSIFLRSLFLDELHCPSGFHGTLNTPFWSLVIISTIKISSFSTYEPILSITLIHHCPLHSYSSTQRVFLTILHQNRFASKSVTL